MIKEKTVRFTCKITMDYRFKTPNFFYHFTGNIALNWTCHDNELSEIRYHTSCHYCAPLNCQLVGKKITYSRTVSKHPENIGLNLVEMGSTTRPIIHCPSLWLLLDRENPI